MGRLTGAAGCRSLLSFPRSSFFRRRKIVELPHFEILRSSHLRRLEGPLATNKILGVILCLGLISPLFVSRAEAAPNDDAEVRKAVGALPETWNRHDMQAFGRLFATDAEFVNVAGDWWKGRQEIQTQHAYSHGTIPADTQGFGALRAYYGIFKASTMRFSQIEVRFLRKDVAVAHASWELLGDSRTTEPRRGLFVFVLTRENGGWLIADAQNTEINRTVK